MPEPRDEAQVAEIAEKFGLQALMLYANRLEAIKAAKRILRKNEPEMWPDEVREARLALNEDLRTLQHETQQYLDNRGAGKRFRAALREYRYSPYYAKVQGVIDCITKFAELHGLTFNASPPDVDYSEEVKTMLIDAAIENYQADQEAKEAKVAGEIDAL